MTSTAALRSEEVGAKLVRVRAWLRAAGRPAACFRTPEGFAWITAGGDSHVSLSAAAGVGTVVVTADEAVIVAANNEMARLLDEELPALPFEPVTFPWHRPDEERRILDQLGGGPHPPAEDAELAPLRYTLVPAEVERYRRLGCDAAEALEAACLAAVPGETELAVAARISAEARVRGIVALVNLVAADERIARYRHPLPTEVRLERTLLAAITGRRQGLHASLTRMVSFGRPDDDLAARHRAACRVDARLCLESRPDAALGEVLARGIDQYAAEGYPGEWELHHQGGLTGYAGREIFATPGETHRLAPAQALAWNPSITRAKSEDTVLVSDDAPEILTRATWPREPVTLPAGTIELPVLLAR